MSAAVSEPQKRCLPVLSNSEIRTFRRCAREWKYSYKMLRRPLRDSEAQRFGTLIHLGLDAWWKTAGDAISRYEASLSVLRAVEADEYDLIRTEELMLGYSARWGSEAYETVGVEVEFTVPLVNPDTNQSSRTFQLGGKLDAIAIAPDGRKVVIEHKSTASDLGLGSDYWRRVSALDSQISQYMSCARASGFEAEACVYDVIRKVALRPLKATPVESRKFTAKGLLYANQREQDETPEDYRLRVRESIAGNPEKFYARGEVVRLEGDADDHAYDTWQFGKLMRDAEMSDRYPKNVDSCIRFNSECAFFDVCSGQASIDDDTRFRTAARVHEELKEIA